VAIKFFCDKCGKEMWQGVTTKKQRIEAASEKDCECSDCIVERITWSDFNYGSSLEEEGGVICLTNILA
jgi:hypothetical protein